MLLTVYGRKKKHTQLVFPVLPDGVRSSGQLLECQQFLTIILLFRLTSKITELNLFRFGMFSLKLMPYQVNEQPACLYHLPSPFL